MTLSFITTFNVRLFSFGKTSWLFILLVQSKLTSEVCDTTQLDKQMTKDTTYS